MEIINRKMMVSDLPINEENKGRERFVLAEHKGQYVSECGLSKDIIVWSYAEEIPTKKMQGVEVEE